MVKTLFKDSVIYGGLNAVQKLAPFCIIPLVIRRLGNEALKIYDVAFAYAFLFSWLVILGQDAAASVLFFDEKKTTFNKRQVTGYAFFLQLGSLVLFTGLFFLAGGPLSRSLFSNDAAIAGRWRTALLILPGQIVLNYALNLLLWQRRKAAYAALCFMQTAASIGSVYLAVAYFKGSLLTLFYCLIGSVSITALASLAMVKAQLTAPLFPVNRALVKALLLLGWPFALTAFFQQIVPAVDRFFLLRYHYGGSLAPYVLASKLGSLVSFGASAFVLAFTPYSLTKLNEDSAEEELSELFRFVSVTAFLAVPFALLFKDALLAVFADASYREATRLLPFFFFGWVFDLFGYFTVLGVYRSHKTHLSLLLFVIGFVLVSILNVLLVPPFGLYGAALSFCLCKAALFFLSRFWLKKYFHLRLHAAGFTTAFLLAALCCYLSYTLPLWINVLFLGILYGAVALYWRKKNGFAFLSLKGITNRRTRSIE